jgi:16S rRNA (adenine1518-N6/adenine1519-N6)-dimethyltransferase
MVRGVWPATLPFLRAADIMFKLFEISPRVQRYVLMFQREMAQRITSHHNSKQYGALTISAAVWARAQLLFHVSAGSFYPSPDINASVVMLTPHPRPLLSECCRRHLARVIKGVFSARRKKLRNGLKACDLWDLFKSLDNPKFFSLEDHRPEQVPRKLFFELAFEMCQKAGTHQEH